MFAAMKCGKINRELEIVQIEKDRISYAHLSFKLASNPLKSIKSLIAYKYAYKYELISV